MQKIRRIVCAGCAVVLFFSFSGCTGTGASSVVPATSQSTVNVAQNTSSPGPTKEYVMPQEMVNFLGRTPDEILQDLADSSTPNLYTDAWINTEGTPTLLITEEQRINWLANSERLLEEHISIEARNGVTVQVSTDKKVVTMYANEDVNPVSILTGFVGVMTEVFNYHFFSDIMWKDFQIVFTFVNQDTGYVLAQATLPTEALEYTPEDWETSRTRDVVENPLPYEIEGYTVPGPSSSGVESGQEEIQKAVDISLVAHNNAPSLAIVNDTQPIDLTWRQKLWIWIYDNPFAIVFIGVGIIAAIAIVRKCITKNNKE